MKNSAEGTTNQRLQRAILISNLQFAAKLNKQKKLRKGLNNFNCFLQILRVKGDRRRRRETSENETIRVVDVEQDAATFPGDSRAGLGIGIGIGIRISIVTILHLLRR